MVTAIGLGEMRGDRLDEESGTESILNVLLGACKVVKRAPTSIFIRVVV